MPVIRDYLNKKFGDYDSDLKSVRIGDFTSLVRITETVSSSNEVVQIPLEDGSVISDHVILNPTILTISGSVSNVFLRGDAISQKAENINRTVSVIDQYLPSRTQTQLTKIANITNSVNNAISKFDAAFDAGQDVLDAVGLSPEQALTNNQLDFYNQMTSYRENGTLIKIGMPFKEYDNMVITLLEFNTDNVDDALNFTIEAIKVDFVKTRFTRIDIEKNVTGEAAEATASVSDKGSQNPQTVSVSAASRLLDSAVGYLVGGG